MSTVSTSIPKKQTLSLKIGDVSPFPFVACDFEVAIHLIDNLNSCNLKNIDQELPVSLKLFFFEKPPKPCPDNLMEIIKPKDGLFISKSGTLKATIRLNDCSINYENKKFVLQASAEMLNGVYITPAVSEPMFVVRYRLRVQNTIPTPDVWYKDEGGRDKVIELNIALLNQNGKLVTEKRIPLKISLLYEGGQLVHNQDILKIADGNRVYIDETGTAILRMRIDDVSKNHQRQLFVIQVAPDIVQYPLNSDISSDSCSAIEVRSKRNKRMRDRDIFLPHKRDGISSMPSTPSTHTNTLQHHTSSLPHPASSSGVANIDSSFSQQSKPVNNPEMSLNSIYHWCQTVLRKLQAFQWEEIGVDKNDGKIIYSMGNPNNHIVEIITLYNEQVHQSFFHLHNRLTQQSINQDLIQMSTSGGGTYQDSSYMANSKNNQKSGDDDSGSDRSSSPMPGRQAGTNASSTSHVKFATSSNSGNMLDPNSNSSGMLDIGMPLGLNSSVSWGMPDMPEGMPPENPGLRKNSESMGFNFSVLMDNDDDDRDVCYILAKPFKVFERQLGLAAYDRDLALVGFYDTFDFNGKTVAKLVRVNLQEFSIDLGLCANRIVIEYINKNDPAVLIRVNNTPDDAWIYAFSQIPVKAELFQP